MEKASMGTAVGHGSVDPKVVIGRNLKKKKRPRGVKIKKNFLPDRKGSGLIFPHLDAVVKGLRVFLNEGSWSRYDGNVFTLSETLAVGPERVFSSC